jgi:hypothetical protein
MRSIYTILIYLGILISCSNNENKTINHSYVKVSITAESLNPTVYNKGIGVHYYSYFDLTTDSVIYLYPEFSTLEENAANYGKHSYVNKAFTGKFDKTNFKDSLKQLINALNWRPTGIIHNIPEGSTYCAWEYNVEFRIGEQVKNYTVTAGVSDTLDSFFDFFQQLEYAPWDKSPADPRMVNIDQEVVNEMKSLGVYEKIELPYFFPDCDTTIDFSKLVGRWRSVGEYYHTTRKNNFRCYTFNQDQTFLIQNFHSGKFEDLIFDTYTVDTNKKSILFPNGNGSMHTYTITQLTDSCMYGIQKIHNGPTYNLRFNRY